MSSPAADSKVLYMQKAEMNSPDPENLEDDLLNPGCLLSYWPEVYRAGSKIELHTADATEAVDFGKGSGYSIILTVIALKHQLRIGDPFDFP